MLADISQCLLSQISQYLYILYTQYLTQNLVFMWSSVLWENVYFFFCNSFLLVSLKLLFWEVDWVRGDNCTMIWDFLDLLKVSKILSLKLFRNSYILCLLLIITLRFTCGEKICKVSKSYIVLRPRLYAKFYFAVYVFINPIQDNSGRQKSSPTSFPYQFLYHATFNFWKTHKFARIVLNHF